MRFNACTVSSVCWYNVSTFPTEKLHLLHRVPPFGLHAVISLAAKFEREVFT